MLCCQFWTVILKCNENSFRGQRLRSNVTRILSLLWDIITFLPSYIGFWSVIMQTHMDTNKNNTVLCSHAGLLIFTATWCGKELLIKRSAYWMLVICKRCQLCTCDSICIWYCAPWCEVRCCRHYRVLLMAAASEDPTCIDTVLEIWLPLEDLKSLNLYYSYH